MFADVLPVEGLAGLGCVWFMLTFAAVAAVWVVSVLCEYCEHWLDEPFKEPAAPPSEYDGWTGPGWERPPGVRPRPPRRPVKRSSSTDIRADRLRPDAVRDRSTDAY
jgi:hypothetical protein